MITCFLLWNNVVSTLQKINTCYNKQLQKGGLYMEEVTAFNQYMIDIRNLNSKILTKEEEQELGYAILNGDRNARKKLVEANLRYVVKLASKYANMGYPIEELIQEGNKGLVYATYKYDVRCGNTFLSYATWWIKKAINNYIETKNSVLTLSPGMKDLIRKYKKALKELEGSDEVITDEVMAKYLKVSLDDIEVVKRCISMPVELDDEENNVELKYEEEYNYIRDYLGKDLDRLFINAKLNDREIFVLKARNGYYGDIYTYQEIANVLNVKLQRVQQIATNALKKVRLCRETDKLSEYLDNPKEALENLKIEREKLELKRTRKMVR